MESKAIKKGFASAAQLPQLPEATKTDNPGLMPLNEIQANLLNYVASVPYAKVEITQKYPLKDILVIAILAVIGGAKGWEDIENYGLCICIAAMVRKISGLTLWETSVTILFGDCLKELILKPKNSA